MRVVAACGGTPAYVAFDGSRAQAIFAFAAAYPRWAAAPPTVLSPTALSSVLLPRAAAGGASVLLLQDSADPRFDLARLASLFPPLFVAPAPAIAPGGASGSSSSGAVVYAPIAGMPYDASLPVPTALFSRAA